MKTLPCFGISVLAAILANTAMAQVMPCGGEAPVDTSDIRGAAQFEIASTSHCKGPAVNTSFGPFPLMNTLSAVTTTKVLVISPTDVVSETAVEEEVGGIRQDFNGQQLRRLGELDAMQGKALNMLYADDLGYLQGYTQGQKKRQAVPGRIQVQEPRRGFVGF